MKTMNQTTSLVSQANCGLSVEEAAERLLNEQSVLAAEFPDLTEEGLCNAYPEPVVLSPGDFYGLRKKEVIRYLQSYERFTVYP
jgi:hypothetical protein